MWESAAYRKIQQAVSVDDHRDVVTSTKQLNTFIRGDEHAHFSLFPFSRKPANKKKIIRLLLLLFRFILRAANLELHHITQAAIWQTRIRQLQYSASAFHATFTRKSFARNKKATQRRTRTMYTHARNKTFKIKISVLKALSLLNAH